MTGPFLFCPSALLTPAFVRCFKIKLSGGQGMKLAEAFGGLAVEEIKTKLAGATVRIYACPPPKAPEKPVTVRNDFLAEFVLQSPAFDGDTLLTVENPVVAKGVGVPLFVRVTGADGVVVADFSAGPGDMDVKLAATSCSKGAPVQITKFQIRPEKPNATMFVSPRDRLKQQQGG
jgi:hypothetical protein